MKNLQAYVRRSWSGDATLMREFGSPTTRAEGQAFKRAAARFGFGLYLREKKA